MAQSPRLTLSGITALQAPWRLRRAKRRHGIAGFAHRGRMSRSASAGTRWGAPVPTETDRIGSRRRSRATATRARRGRQRLSSWKSTTDRDRLVRPGLAVDLRRIPGAETPEEASNRSIGSSTKTLPTEHSPLRIAPRPPAMGAASIRYRSSRASDASPASMTRISSCTPAA